VQVPIHIIIMYFLRVRIAIASSVQLLWCSQMKTVVMKLLGVKHSEEKVDEWTPETHWRRHWERVALGTEWTRPV